MIRFTASARTDAKASTVWEIYRNVAGWPTWDAGLARTTLNGPFVVGTPGTLQPTGGPELAFTLIEVEEERGFADRTPVGADTAIFGRHRLTPVADGTEISHSIEIDGPDASDIAQVFSQAELLQTVTSLARFAESMTHG